VSDVRGEAGRAPSGERPLAWWATALTVVASSALVLVACTSAPAPSVPAVPATSSPTPIIVAPDGTPTPTPLPTPTAPPGPTLTKAQFSALISSGKIGTREATLKPASIDGADDPDGEDKEGEQQSEAKSCVKMYQVSGKALLSQASDDDQGAVMQLYSGPAVASQLFDLNRTCAAEQAKYSPDTSFTEVAVGQDGSARWWFSKDPDLNYQVTVAYGNVLAYILVDADTDAAALTRAFIAQIDDASQG
jgi:hypothetical protein